MSFWKFQLLPSQRDVLGNGYRMDPVGQRIEDEVNDALPYRFKFHKIGKVVLWLGRNDDQPDYAECLGVAAKQMTQFSLESYVTLSDEEKATVLRAVVTEAIKWFEESFDDAQFVQVAKTKLPWAT